MEVTNASEEQERAAVLYKKYWCSQLNQLAKQIMVWRKEKGFYSPETLQGQHPHDMLGKLMLVTSELGEAAEAVRKDDRANFEEEIADAFIRLMDISESIRMDLADQVAKKMVINEGRPRRHGKVS